MGKSRRGVWGVIGQLPPTNVHPLSSIPMMVHPPNPTTTTTRPPNQCRLVPLLCRSYGPSPRPRPSSPPGRQKPPARHEQPGAGRQSPLPLTNKPTSAAERETFTYSLALHPRDQLPGPAAAAAATAVTAPPRAEPGRGK